MFKHGAKHFITMITAVCVLLFLVSAEPAHPAYTDIAAGSNHSLALNSTDGKVWAWGYNNEGQLGDGSTLDRITPVQVSGLTDVSKIAAGSAHNFALKSDGTVWAWGYNYYGQFGDGTTASRITPVQVFQLSGVSQIAAGSSHSLALKSDGTVWAFGYDSVGLGDGITKRSSTPVQVSGLIGVSQIAAGGSHSLALKSDGTVWAWGDNTYTQLGDDTDQDRSTPVQVSGLTDVSQIAAGDYYSLALKSDGTVRAWGYNYYGQLGDGTTTNRSTPVQVSFLSGVSEITAGSDHGLALKSDGTVWAWGSNRRDQLGDGAVTSKRTTPFPVSGLTDISQIAAGSGHSLALKSEGTGWAWGYNSKGQLGDGTATQRSTPVQVIFPAPPTITGQKSLSVAEGSSLTLSVSDLTITDPDSASFTLSVQDGTNYTCTGSTVTPAAGVISLTVPVKVSDGTNDSSLFNLTITVTALQNATLRGAVKDAAGKGISGIAVYAFQPGQVGFFSAKTVAGGNYELKVMSGRWTLVKPSLPENGDYTFSAGMVGVTEIAENGTETAPDIVLETVLHTLSGKVMDEKGIPLTDAEGWVYARLESSFRTLGSTRVKNGVFSLKVPAGTMYVKLVPEGKYIFREEIKITVAAGASSDVTLIADTADEFIKGVLQDENGNTVSDIQGKIFADPDSAESDSQKASFQNGEYQLRASAGVWLLNYQLDTDMYISNLDDPIRVLVGKGESTVTQNFVLTPLNRVVSGQVTDDAGNSCRVRRMGNSPGSPRTG